MACVCCSSSICCDPCASYATFVPCCNTSITLDCSYQPRCFQEIYYAPEPAPQIQVVRQRLPDPPADVIDRVIVVPQAKKYVYQVVEVPTKPPPVVQQRYVQEAPNTPLPRFKIYDRTRPYTKKIRRITMVVHDCCIRPSYTMLYDCRKRPLSTTIVNDTRIRSYFGRVFFSYIVR